MCSRIETPIRKDGSQFGSNLSEPLRLKGETVLEEEAWILGWTEIWKEAPGFKEEARGNGHERIQPESSNNSLSTLSKPRCKKSIKRKYKETDALLHAMHDTEIMGRCPKMAEQ